MAHHGQHEGADFPRTSETDQVLEREQKPTVISHRFRRSQRSRLGSKHVRFSSEIHVSSSVLCNSSIIARARSSSTDEFHQMFFFFFCPHSELESLVLSLCVATINDGGNKETGVVMGCENSKILLYTLKGKMVKKIEYHKGAITAVQLTSQDVLVTGAYTTTVMIVNSSSRNVFWYFAPWVRSVKDTFTKQILIINFQNNVGINLISVSYYINEILLFNAFQKIEYFCTKKYLIFKV